MSDLNLAPSNRHQKFASLVYHGIEHGNAARRYIVSEQQLRQQLEFLKSENYVVEGFAELEDRLHSSQGFPNRWVLFTVDDGEESSLRVAELLHDFGCKGSFFVTHNRSHLGMRGYLRETQIRELRQMHFSVGTHGVTHRALTAMDEATCRAELWESKQWLEAIIAEPVRYMSAPGGFMNPRTLKLAHEQGYSIVGTSEERMNSPDVVAFAGKVGRVCIRRHFCVKDLRSIVEGEPRFYTWRKIRAAALVIPKKFFCESHGPQ